MHTSPRRSSLTALAAPVLLGLATVASVAQSPGGVAGMGPLAQQETAIWDALQSGNWDVAASYMAPNFVFIGPQIGDRAETMQGMKTCKFHSYKLHDAQTHTVTPDVVLLTYAVTVDQNCASHPFKGDLNCSSLWQQKDGKWIGIAHTEAIAAPKP